jgi:hypothetical protein
MKASASASHDHVKARQKGRALEGLGTDRATALFRAAYAQGGPLAIQFVNEKLDAGARAKLRCTPCGAAGEEIWRQKSNEELLQAGAARRVHR